jgi:hypothetical protein
MRIKVTFLVTAFALAGGAVAAQAAPIPVAQYSFATQGDVGAFSNVSAGGKCAKKWRNRMALGVTLGAGTNSCVLRTSVVADSSDLAPDQIISAVVGIGRGGSAKLQKKAYQGVAVRQSETAGYELRVFPVAKKWQVYRDPKGTGGPVLLGSGSGSFIKSGTESKAPQQGEDGEMQKDAKTNNIALRAFDFGGTSTSVTATINGRNVLSNSDTGMDQPDGRRSAITTGVKGTGAGAGVVGVFDDVTVQVPNPF